MIRLAPLRPLPRLVAACVSLIALTALAAGYPAAAAQGKQQMSKALSVRGADLSFLPQLERAGVTYSAHGKARRPIGILSRHGANWMRIRVWVDPPKGYSDERAALALARRAEAAGMKVLLDLHYSDFWADPAHQDTPQAWRGQDLATLAQTVRRYTRQVVSDFAAQGTPVDMIQVGNEITGGFLWPLGQIYQSDGQHWSEFARLLQAGISGARAGNPADHKLRVMVHIDRGGDNGGSRWFFDHLAAQGVDFDVIGESYYPMWHGSLADLTANLNDLATAYGKDIVVVETAYPWTTANGDSLANFFEQAAQLPDGALYPPTPAGQAGYFEALRKVLLQVPGGHGLGFVTWEPEWVPGVGWAPGQGNPNDNLTQFDFSGASLPSLVAYRPPAR